MSEADKQTAVVPIEILQQLSAFAESQGISLPGVVRMAPVINVTQDIRALSLEIGRLVAKENIFLKADAIVTLDPENGDIRPMTARRFPTWVEEFCKFIAPDSRRVRNSIPTEDAVQILDSDIFRSCLRPLEAVHLIRLPTRRQNGDWEFLEPGYDQESGIYTVETLTYDMEWPLDQALAFLMLHSADYPWAWPEEDTERDLKTNRSFAVHVAAMVGTYCRAMFAPGTIRPLILYSANQPGTGKSTLVAMVLNMIFGRSTTSKTPKDDEKMDSELETIARSRKPYVFFDDIGHGLYSNPLNRFITSPGHSGRIMGGNAEIFEAPAVTQVFATGNDLKLSRDLMRRALAVELFLPGEVRGRQFKTIISPQYLSRPEVRASFLSAMCALVKNALTVSAELRHHPRPLESFEDWTSLIGAIVLAADLQDPLLPPDLSAGGSEDDDEMKELLIKVATASPANCSFDRTALVTAAREHHLLEYMVGVKDDKPIDGATSKKFGIHLRKWRARELVDEHGRKFIFGHQRQKKGAAYPLTFVSPPKPGAVLPQPVKEEMDFDKAD